MQNRSLLALKILILVLVSAAVAIFTISATRPPDPADIAKAKSDLAQLVAAVQKYKQDYGHYPAGGSYGRYENVVSNALLIKVLTANNDVENPKKIKYLDIPQSILTSRSSAYGIDKKDGAWKDPWSWPYRVRVTTDGSDQVTNPYSGDSDKTIPQAVIAWSIGRDGIQGNWRAPNTFNGSDDVVSWK